MKNLYIELDKESLLSKAGVITGTATILSKEDEDWELKEEETFDFYYEIDSEFIQCYLGGSKFEDQIEVIDIMMKQAIQNWQRENN